MAPLAQALEGNVVLAAMQAAEAVVATIERSEAGMRALGAAITLANVAIVWHGRRQLRAAFGRKLRGAEHLGAALALATLLPASIAALGGPQASAAWRSWLPLAVNLGCMAAQFGVLVYGGTQLAAKAVRLVRPQSRGLQNPSRRAALRGAMLGVPMAILGGSIAGALASQQRPVVTRLPLRAGRDFRALAGLRIAHFSDVHIGDFVGHGRIEEIAEVINAQRPDIVVCTGDLLDDRIEQLEPATRLLRALHAPVFMCMGNHEYIACDDNGAVLAGLSEGGATVLRNAAQKVSILGSHLWLGGTDFPDSPGGTLGERTPVADSLDAALAHMRDDGAPRIMLSHHPKSFIEGRTRPIDLMLSGHTHGGQINVGRVGDFALSPLLPFEFYHKGLYEHEGRKLYVNSGIGSWLPVRLNCPPEITLVEIV